MQFIGEIEVESTERTEDYVFTSPLILNYEPTESNHGVSKHYVDHILGNMDAGLLDDGVISEGVLPRFTYHVTNQPGSGYIYLSETGVEEGEHSKVLVDMSGRVREGLRLSAEDLPELDWDLVILDDEMVLGDYGIEGILGFLGGRVGSEFLLNGVPVENRDLINIEYINDTLNTSEIVPVGGLISYPGHSVLREYLRANGAVLKKDEYPELYSVIGDKFNLEEVGEDEFTLPDIEGVKRTVYYIRFVIIEHTGIQITEPSFP